MYWREKVLWTMKVRCMDQLYEDSVDQPVLRIRIRDPESGIRCLFYPRIRDTGWVKSQDLDPGYRMNNSDHITKSLETIFGG
jgi:hypothetical protein